MIKSPYLNTCDIIILLGILCMANINYSLKNNRRFRYFVANFIKRENVTSGMTYNATSLEGSPHYVAPSLAFLKIETGYDDLHKRVIDIPPTQAHIPPITVAIVVENLFKEIGYEPAGSIQIGLDVRRDLGNTERCVRIFSDKPDNEDQKTKIEVIPARGQVIPDSEIEAIIQMIGESGLCKKDAQPQTRLG